MDHPEDCALAIKITFECSLCGGIFAKRSELQSHKCHVPKNRRHYLCELCGYFIQPDRMQIHYQEIHQKFTEFDCCACESSFGTERDLVVHQNTVHYDGKSFGSKRYKCHICKRGFAFEGLLKRHYFNVHEGKKDVFCDACKQSFWNKHDMLHHWRTVHEDGRKYTCRHCREVFGTRSTMADHVRNVHYSLKELLCRDCGGTRFDSRADLKSHLRTEHSERKVFKCETCQRDYSTKFTLTRHLNTVHS